MLFNKGISNAEEEGSFTKEGGGNENF